MIAFWIFLRSVQRVRYLTQPEELEVRRLLLLHGERDSLGYFATRRDKAIVFSPDNNAAIAYRVVNGVSLASGDPLGDPLAWPAAIQRWLVEARRYGWSPAVLSASEEAAEAYVDAGLRALSMGDEAIIDVADFTLEGRTMRPVRQAVTRVQRAAITRRSCGTGTCRRRRWRSTCTWPSGGGVRGPSAGSRWRSGGSVIRPTRAV